MKVECAWNGDFLFENRVRGHRFDFDANSPHGGNTAPSPKEVLLSAICGCTGMDIASDAKKRRYPLKELKISAVAETTATYPKIFQQIDLVYEIILEPYDRETHLPLLLRAVEESMTKYCGVSAMVAPTSPMYYTVTINGEIEARDRTNFPTEKREK